MNGKRHRSIWRQTLSSYARFAVAKKAGNDYIAFSKFSRLSPWVFVKIIGHLQIGGTFLYTKLQRFFDKAIEYAQKNIEFSVRSIVA